MPSLVTTMGRRPAILGRWEDPGAPWRVALAGPGFVPSEAVRHMAEVDDLLDVPSMPIDVRNVAEVEGDVVLAADAVSFEDISTADTAAWAIVYLELPGEPWPVATILELGVALRGISSFAVRWDGQRTRGAVYRLSSAR